MDNSTADAATAIEEAAVPARDAAPGRGLSRRALTRACSYMEAHLGERLSLRDIAASACVSRSHFARMFRVSTGYSVMAYLYRLRVERAKAALIDADVPLAELSASMGFSHHSHFTRVFRRHTGMSPSTFVRLHGEDRAATTPGSRQEAARQAEPESAG